MSETVSDNQDFSANSPGTILKRCREFHQITIDEAAEATKIGVNYLTALENDSIREFANIAYLKGFLRIYSNYLSLNDDDMVRLFERLYEPDGGHRKGHSSLAGDKPPKRRKWFSWQKLALPSLLLLLLLITATILDRTQAPAPPPPQAPKPEQPAAQVAAVQPVLSSAVKSAPKQKIKEEAVPDLVVKKENTVIEKKEPAKEVAEVQKSFFVKMKVLQNSRLAVTIDGAATQSYDLNSGDIIEWKAANSIALELSNSGGVEAELNGKKLDSFGPAGKPAYVVIGAEGIKR